MFLSVGIVILWSALFFQAEAGVGPIIHPGNQPSGPSQPPSGITILSFKALKTLNGRLSFSSYGSCDEDNQNIFHTTWQDCHAFKRNFDPVTGQPIVDNADHPEGLRPLSATVELSYIYKTNPAPKPIGRTSDTPPTLPLYVCPNKAVTQTDLDGYFTVNSPTPCSDKVAPDFISMRVQLKYSVMGPLHPGQTTNQVLGQVRGEWLQSDIAPLYNSTDYGIPLYNNPKVISPFFTVSTVFPVLHSIVLDIGNIVLPPSGTSNAVIGALNLSLNEWQTVVELHERLRKILTNDDLVDTYQKMFLTDTTVSCTQCYRVEFILDSPGSFGSAGFMMLSKVKTNLIWSHNGLDPTAHEFGHSIQFALAPVTVAGGDGFNLHYIDSHGNLKLKFHNDQQLQDWIIAFGEGLAPALGRYVADGCSGGWGVAYDDPSYDFWTGWNLTNDNALDGINCDQSGECSYHHFRWHMQQHNVIEGSPEWNRRLTTLIDLNHIAQQSTTNPYAQPLVVSNNEARYGMFICDLLTKNQDISHLNGGVRTSKTFFKDYTYYLGEALGGFLTEIPGSNILLDKSGQVVGESLTWGTYTQDVAPKDFHITLPQLFQAFQNFCPECVTGLPKAGDALYPEKELSINGVLSPQALGKYMVSQGWLTLGQLNNVLRANYMEEILLSSSVDSQ